MVNKQKFLSLVTGSDSSVITDAKNRLKNRAMLEKSQAAALKVLFDSRINSINYELVQIGYLLDITTDIDSRNLLLDVKCSLKEILETLEKLNILLESNIS